MAFLWSLWPFNLNWWLFQLKLLHMIHISWKNYEILKFWVLDFGFGLQNFFWPLKVFLRSLVSNKSSGMQKSYVWAIFHAKQFLLLIFHSGSLCKEAFTDLRVWTLKHWFFNKSSNIFNIFYHPKEMVNVHDVCMYTFLHTYIVCANNTMFWTTLSLCSLLCCTVLRWYGISKSPWISSEPGISLAILTISMGWLLV